MSGGECNNEYGFQPCEVTCGQVRTVSLSLLCSAKLGVISASVGWNWHFMEDLKLEIAIKSLSSELKSRKWKCHSSNPCLSMVSPVPCPGQFPGNWKIKQIIIKNIPRFCFATLVVIFSKLHIWKERCWIVHYISCLVPFSNQKMSELQDKTPEFWRKGSSHNRKKILFHDCKQQIFNNFPIWRRGPNL